MVKLGKPNTSTVQNKSDLSSNWTQYEPWCFVLIRQSDSPSPCQFWVSRWLMFERTAGCPGPQSNGYPQEPVNGTDFTLRFGQAHL